MTAKLYVMLNYVFGLLMVITRFISIACADCKVWHIIANIITAMFMTVFTSSVVWVLRILLSDDE